MTGGTIAQAYDFYRAGDLHHAEKLCRFILQSDDKCADGWLLLGVLADHARAPQDAENFLRKAAELAPNDPRIWNTLGTVRDGAHDLDGAAQAYETALRVRPDYAAAWHNLGEVHRALGRHKDAAEHYRKALRIDPNLAPAASNLLFSLHFDPDLSDARIWEEHRRWGEAVATRVRVMPPAESATNPDRKLTIGYIGPDFREHAVARFFEPLLAAHDRGRFRYLLYSECPVIDSVGKRLRECGDTWRVIRGQNAEAVSRLIRADGVDILVELAGHTRDNRLDVMAMKPAPVQMTFLGYPFPTGLPRIDYRISDGVLDPIEAPVRSGFGESILRMPEGVCCFAPPRESPPVSALPLEKNDFITFGCHHPMPKLNPELLSLWSEVAKAVPTSRFLFMRNSWDGAPARELRRRLDAAMLPMDRVELRKTTIAPGDYLRVFHDMDVVLDAVPFNGHTMTCESLWMGVPVLTLRGDRPAGRLTSSVLTAMNLKEFIAETPEDFIAKAAVLSKSRRRLYDIRASLRDTLTATIGNSARYARGIESLYREAWRTHCRMQESAPSAAKPFVEPTWDEVHTRGCGALEAGNPDEAAVFFRKASTLNPNAVPPRAMLAGILSDRCDLEGAAEQYTLALKAGSDPKVRIAAATVLPPIYQDRDQIAECRAMLVERLNRLHADGVRLDPLRGPIPNLFHVAYQGGNDRDIMASFARLFAPSEWATEPLDPAPAVDGRVRVGLISQYFHNHTIGTLNRGFIEKYDRQRFRVTVLAAGRVDDEFSRIYRQQADDYVELPPETASAVRLIRGMKLDVAYFADLGMSCVTLPLAHARLAPRQAVTWGHPLTTGIRTVDDFLSSELFESEDAQGHYTERLLKLKGINTFYDRPRLDRPYTRAEFNLPADARLYGCPQTLFKFHCDFDMALKSILEEDAEGRLVLIEGRNRIWKAKLLERWQRTMPRVIDRIHWIGTLPRTSFLGLCSVCDVMLDPFHFGGGNTTLEALALGVPVVTLPSPYLRARLSLGFYKHIGMEEFIAGDVDSYIRIALDKTLPGRGDLQNRASPLFEDSGSLHSLEDYLSSTK